MTTRANSLFPRPDLHRQDTPPSGLRTNLTNGKRHIEAGGRRADRHDSLLAEVVPGRSPNLIGQLGDIRDEIHTG
jgi:hypothetical protein